MGQSCSGPDASREKPAEEVADEVGSEASDGAEASSSNVVRPGEPVPLSKLQLKQRQQAALAGAAELLDVSCDDASLLLASHRWSLDVLSEVFFADPERTRQRAGLVSTRDSWDGIPESGALCAICYTGEPMSLLPCEHCSYCQDCWENYVATTLGDSKTGLELKCPTEKCHVRLRPCDFRQVCKGPVLERYERFALEAFVDGCGTLAWCPGPRCDVAFDISTCTGTETQVRCACGTQWCSRCKADMHTPVSCEVVKAWSQKHGDADTMWMTANTKPCPKCQRAIEKNGGCMHMTCKNGCGHEFCWICLEEWSIHNTATGGFYQCNRYSPDTLAAKNTEVLNKQSEAKRYFHFQSRFAEHELAQRFADTDQRDLLRRIAEDVGVRRGLGAKQLEFLEAAVDETVSCRRFLKWTYAFAFVSKQADKPLELFDFHQAQLEGTLERLSDVLENSKWQERLRLEFDEVKAQVTTLTDVVRRSHLSLAAAVQQQQEDM